MKRRRTPRKIKAPSSSSAKAPSLKTLTQPSKAPSSSSAKAPSLKTLTQPSNAPSSSSAKAPSSSSSEGPSLETLTQGDKPYSITDMLSICNLSPSEMDEQLKIVRGAPTRLKATYLKPDRDITTILQQSKTLQSQPPPPATATARARGRPLTFPGMTMVVGKLIYREGRGDIRCYVGGAWMGIPRNTDRIEKMRNDGALFILLVTNFSVLRQLAYAFFPQRFPCIVVTAEGPPDFLIRMEKELKLPVLALLDSDPRSLQRLAFYGRRLNNIKWLGIRPTDMVGHLDQHELTFPMTHKDIETANILLKDSYIENRPEWLKELHIMLKIKRKIEVELLSALGMLDYLTDVFLPMKLQQEDWI